MHYIVGLGNPGTKYDNSRHNVGFILVDALVDSLRMPTFHTSSKLSGEVSEGVVDGTEVTVLKPDTYMNKSGSAVKKLCSKDEVGKLVVVYDDVDLPLGEFRVSVGRGDGGHNGIKSIVSALGTKEFIRVRIGIAQKTVWPWEKGTVRRPKGDALPKFVLKEFSKKELQQLDELAPKVIECLVTILNEGVEKAMNRFN